MLKTSVQPKKSLGQHFLRDANILRKIADSLALQKGDVLLEIGAGEGALTRLLALHPVSLLAVEIDSRVIPQLKQEFESRVQIIHADVRTLDFRELSHSFGKPLRIVGNIPYYLTSEILFHIFHYYEIIADATLMMQLEVAERLVAKPHSKAYGILSVFTQFYSTCEFLFRVSRNVFFPKPAVDSAVIRLSMKKSVPAIDKKLFSTVVRGTFGKRRKTLRNSLKYLGVTDDVLASLPLSGERRPESLSVDEFIFLTHYLSHQQVTLYEKH